MTLERRASIIGGSLFLIAMAASLAGGGIMEGLIDEPGYLESLPNYVTPMTLGVVLEFINAFSVLGIAVVMVPVLRKHNETLATGYLGLRILETISCIAGAMIPLLLLPLSERFAASDGVNSGYFDTLGVLIKSARALAMGTLLPVTFGCGAILFYAALCRYRLLPRFIPRWGMIATFLMLLMNLLPVGMIVKALMVAPIILNEIFMGIWLITRGFVSPSEAG